MKEEQFEFGEKVLVRNYENEEWIERVYVGTMPNCKGHWVMKFGQNKKTIDGHPSPWSWNQVRKIEKPEPIEHWVGRIQTQVMNLMDRVGKIEDVLHPATDLIDIKQPETIEQRMGKFEAIFNANIKNINEQFESIKKQLK